MTQKKPTEKRKKKRGKMQLSDVSFPRRGNTPIYSFISSNSLPNKVWPISPLNFGARRRS